MDDLTAVFIPNDVLDAGKRMAFDVDGYSKSRCLGIFVLLTQHCEESPVIRICIEESVVIKRHVPT